MRIVYKSYERTCACDICNSTIGYYPEELLHDARYESFIICPACGSYIVFKKRPPMTPEQIKEFIMPHNGSGKP